MEKLKIVVLESPYDCWNNPFVGNFLKDLLGVKLRGYGKEYPYGVLPFDGADLISTHLAVCRVDQENQLVPLMAFRWTSYNKCKLHYMNFPGMSLLQQANASAHIADLEKIIADIEHKTSDICYTSCFTIEPSERTDKNRSLMLRELITLLLFNYQKEMNYSEILAGGTIRFKIDKWLSTIGHMPLNNNPNLGPIKVKHLAGESVQVMHLKKFSFEAIKIAKKWQHLWDDRLIIQAESKVNYKNVG